MMVMVMVVVVVVVVVQQYSNMAVENGQGRSQQCSAL
jgi:hypothetical protein